MRWSEEKEKERRRKISETSKKNNKSGGYRNGSGRGKKGTYKGFWCDSSYELAWVIYHLDNKIPIERNIEKFIYIYDGEEKNYIPDFKINNIYYEIKGYADDKVEFKLKYFPHNIKILFKEDLKYIFDYVIEKYGKNFISLYDEKISKDCLLCEGYIHRTNKRGLCRDCINKNKSIKKTYKKEKVKNIEIKKCGCGGTINYRSNMCSKCNGIYRRKVDRPTYEELLILIETYGNSGVSKIFGVSEAAIRKWKNKKYETDKTKTETGLS